MVSKMKLSISNIAWNTEDNQRVYEYLSKKGFTGIEIAPTKLFPESPYDHIEEAVEYFAKLKDSYGLEVSSMQSIWYGQLGNIFESENDRIALQSYTFKAIDFASAIGCKNLVFGNPKARNKGESHTDDEVFGFFKSISDYAHNKNTCIALEPNPEIYGTDFINFTKQAFDFCKKSGCEKLRVNVDFGTIIYNNETLEWLQKDLALVNHIHISEPYLKKIEKRELHNSLTALEQLGYDKYVSIEMGLQNTITDVFDVIDYIYEVFKK